MPVWQDSHKLVLSIYDITSSFPSEEKYGLTSQIRRSVASVPANIVEGLYRNTTAELIRFLFIARGSAGETIYHTILATDLKYFSKEQYTQIRTELESIAKQLNNWINSLKSK